jgi:uncharacterized protein (DUF2235 family)
LEHSPSQLAFYDPGVGTLSDPNAVIPWGMKLKKLGGIAFGFGLLLNVSEAYAYLMEYYEEGDRLFFFGFSRGAYTVRVLSGLICQVGLLRKGCQNLIPYALKAYQVSYKEKNKPITEKFRNTYSRTIAIDFVGVWDTVTSIGLFNTISLPKTTTNAQLKTIRHAIAIDERRAYYRQNLFLRATPDQDIKQVWFAGVHSDVGGSYPSAESGLSQISLEWMLREAQQAGLRTDAQQINSIVFDTAHGGVSGPDINQKVHTSLKGFWWLLEYIPRRRRRTGQYFFPGGRRRTIPDGALIHQSVIAKTENNPDYTPNLPSHHTIEL